MMTYVTILVIVLMAALYAILGLPPSFDTYYEKMYFHSIGVGIAALATYLVISIFDLQKHEPPLDFPISYRAFAAVFFAAAGGFFYLSPVLDAWFPDIALGLYVVAFILLGDVGGALYIQLMFLPRKLAGSYSSKETGGLSMRYFLRMLPSRKDWDAYAKMGAGYWLAVITVGSAFIAGLIGFVNLWVRIFSVSFFANYVTWLGLDAQGFLDATLDPHSHEMAVAIMASVVALAAQRFGFFDLTKWKRSLARIGLWVMSIGVIAMTIVFLAISFLNYSPPTLIPSGPEGINGIAGDDAVMSIIGLGAIIALVPLALTKFKGKSSWKDSVRMALLGTWIVAFVINVIQAFFIELNEDMFSTALSANDVVFSELQPMFGIFLLTAIALVLLAVDYYRVSGLLRRVAGWVAGVGILIALVAGALWVYLDPMTGNAFYWSHILGVIVIGISAIVSATVIRATRTTSITIR